MARMTDLVSLRPSPQDEADLRWFFTEADGEMGLKSTFGGMVHQLQMGGGARGSYTPVPREADGRLLEAATRARLISRALEACGREAAAVLREAYSALPVELAELFPAFGELAALVVSTPAADRMWRRSRTNRVKVAWLVRRSLQARKGDPSAGSQVYELRREAEALLAGAARAYSRKRVELLRRSRG